MRQIFVNILLLTLSLFLSLLFADFIIGNYFSTSEIGLASYCNLQERQYINIDYTQETSTNEIGLRSRSINDYPIEKTATLLLGDSYTFGIGVNDNETFTSLLNKNSTKLFINGGKPGASFIDYFKIIQSANLHQISNKVILCVFANDLVNMPNYPIFTKRFKSIELNPKRPFLYHLRKLRYTLLHPKTSFFESVEQNALSLGISNEKYHEWKQHIPKDLLTAIKKEKVNGAFIEMGVLYPNYYEEAFEMNQSDSKVKWNNSKRFLNAIDSFCMLKNMELSIVYLPSPLQYDSLWNKRRDFHPISNLGTTVKQKWLSSNSIFTSKLALWAKKTNTNFLDLTPTFRQLNKKSPSTIFPLDTHWNQYGHQIAFQAIDKWLK